MTYYEKSKIKQQLNTLHCAIKASVGGYKSAISAPLKELYKDRAQKLAEEYSRLASKLEE